MKYIIPPKSFIWDDSIPELKKYGKNVIVIDYDTHEQVPEDYPYTWFKVPVSKPTGLGHMTPNLDTYYGALMERMDDLLRILKSTDVLVISDCDERSLIIYKALQSVRQKRFCLHLWAVTPFNFLGRPRTNAYYRLCQDLSETRSVLILQGQDFSESLPKGTTIPEIIDLIRTKLLKLLPTLWQNFRTMRDYIDQEKILFYDFDLEAYQDTRFSENPLYLKKPFVLKRYGLMGEVIEDEYQKNLQLLPIPRANGKELCRYLKELRVQIAQANNIELSSEPCTYNGACAGTCPKCDDEARFLSEALAAIPKEKQVYPQAELPESVTKI